MSERRITGGGETPEWNASRMIREGRYPGKVCGAKGKRSGEPCQRPASKGRNRCYLHGGRARRKDDPPEKPPSARVVRNRNAKAARRATARAGQAALQRRDLHPETLSVFAGVWAAKIPEASRAEFIMVLDQRMRGFLTAGDWTRFIAAYAG